MEVFSSDAVEVLEYVFPGLLSAWVYYALTAFRRPEATERVIQALIFTGIVQSVVFVEHELALFVGRSCLSFGVWNERSNAVAATITALLVGIAAVLCSTNDRLFSLLRRLHLTTQMAYPTEWFGAFRESSRFVVLHLKDERRLYGWPTEWPSSAHSGHFRIQLASWARQSTDDQDIELANVWSVLINVEDVRWVEFMRKEGDPNDAQAANSAAAIPERAPAQRARESPSHADEATVSSPAPSA